MMHVSEVPNVFANKHQNPWGMPKNDLATPGTVSAVHLEWKETSTRFEEVLVGTVGKNKSFEQYVYMYSIVQVECPDSSRIYIV